MLVYGRLYGNAQKSPGVLKRTQNKETWGKGTCWQQCCVCTFYQSSVVAGGFPIQLVLRKIFVSNHSDWIFEFENPILWDFSFWSQSTLQRGNWVDNFIFGEILMSRVKYEQKYNFGNYSKKITLVSTYGILTRPAVAKRFMKFQVKLATMYFQH